MQRTAAVSSPPSDAVLRLERWQNLSHDQRQRVLNLALPASQVEYAGALAQALAIGEGASPDEVAELAILSGDTPVGFLVLCRGDRLPDGFPEGAAALRALRIDAGQQGRGLGKQALKRVSDWLLCQWPTSRLLALCVDDQNLAARRVYQTDGFEAFTCPRPGRIGLVHYLAKRLEAPQPGDILEDRGQAGAQ